jgi:16S rRNA (adenine1518-N6/adenine1519-N6)-dimethyltransferase
MNEIIELQRTLKEYHITPTKRYGQNFLVNNNIINNIIRSLGNIQDKNILEIGPGIGALTNDLLKTNIKSLFVVEIDKKILPILNKIQSGTDKDFEIINGDALKIEEESIIDGYYTIVANLPYNISTLLIVKWLKKLSNINEIIIMLQKEVADRILAQPSTHAYGRLSVLAQFTCDCELLFDVEPENFFPAPKVTSSIIKLTPKQQQPTTREINNIEKICKSAFNFRRKKIKKSLENIFDNPEIELEKLKIDYNKRPEQLTVDEFFKISTIVK